MAKRKPAKKKRFVIQTLIIQSPPAGATISHIFSAHGTTVPVNLGVTASLDDGLGVQQDQQQMNSDNTGNWHFDFNVPVGNGYTLTVCLTNTPSVCDTHEGISLN